MQADICKSTPTNPFDHTRMALKCQDLKKTWFMRKVCGKGVRTFDRQAVPACLLSADLRCHGCQHAWVDGDAGKQEYGGHHIYSYIATPANGLA